MLNSLQIVDTLYMASALIYELTRELYISRLVRAHGGEFKYGCFNAKILEKESVQYSRVISAIISFSGIILMLLSYSMNADDWLAALAANMPFLLSVLLLGFGTQIAKLSSFVLVLPTGSPKKFIIPCLAALASAVACPFIWLFVTSLDGIIDPVPIFVMFIPMATLLAILFFPVGLGSWLFGTESLTNALPSFLKNGRSAFILTFMLGFYLSETLPKSLPFFLANILITLSLVWALLKITDLGER
jgi:hypothetical protein